MYAKGLLVQKRHFYDLPGQYWSDYSINKYHIKQRKCKKEMVLAVFCVFLCLISTNESRAAGFHSEYNVFVENVFLSN